MSAYIAEHNLSFNTMEHLPKLISIICKNPGVAQGLSCGRTKTTAIVKNVLGQQRFQHLCEELKIRKFSLIADESTDRSTMKHLCLVVRYLDSSFNVQDSFFTLIELVAADATTLYDHIVNVFRKYNIPYETNMIGFASDGANVMMGSRHSLMTLLKNDVPQLYVMKCICHSFHLCASYACEKLPRFVEDLTRDIHNYFSSSPKRTAELREFQSFCDVNIHKILHPAQTRWLSVHSVVCRILEQYGALQLFFTDAVASNDILSAENILCKLRDPTSKLFLQFLEFVLPFFTVLNKEMQSQTVKIHILYKNISNIIRTIFDCFIRRNYLSITPLEEVEFKNTRNHLVIEEVYFGANVAKSILDLQLSSEQLNFFRCRCLDFYIEACSQIISRFPLKNNYLQHFNFMDPFIVKNGAICSIVNCLSAFPNLVNANKLQKIDSEWRLLRNTPEIQSFPEDMIDFWKAVKDLHFGNGDIMFPNLTEFVFNLCCLPHSSATVERKFSQMNLLKTDQRNLLNTETLIGLMHTKEHIGDKNCYDFLIDKNMLSKMNKKDLY